MGISDYFPDAIAKARSRSTNGRGLQSYNAILALATRVITEGGLQSSDPTTANTTILYRHDMSAGRVMVAGVAGVIAADTDVVFIGVGTTETSYDLDGDAAVVLTEDGKTYDIAIVAVDDTAGITLHAVFGAEADDGDEIEPTVAQIMTALAAAAPAGYDNKAGVVVGRIKIQREATDTITMTHVDIDGDADMVAEREVGMLFV